MTDTIYLVAASTTVYLHDLTRSPYPVYVEPTELGKETGAEEVSLTGGKWDVNVPLDTSTKPATPITRFAPTFVGFTQDASLQASLEALLGQHMTLHVGAVSYPNMKINSKKIGWLIVGEDAVGFWYRFTVDLLQVVAASA